MSYERRRGEKAVIRFDTISSCWVDHGEVLTAVFRIRGEDKRTGSDRPASEADGLPRYIV